MSNSNNSARAVEAETIIGMSVGGHPSFPFVYGNADEKTILVQFFGKLHSGVWLFSQNLSKAVQGLSTKMFLKICKGVLQALLWLHSKKILHNDLKADNVVLHNDGPRIVDFGKANMESSSLTYNIEPGSAEHIQYETYHRHLAYELRNIPGSKQSFKTDTYSVGYMIKHLSALTKPPSNKLLGLARMMKTANSQQRISLENALDKLHGIENL